MNKFNKILPLAMLTATGLASAGEMNLDNVEMRTTTVTYNRTAAESPKGSKALYRHLRSAANDVCNVESFGPGMLSRDALACTAKAVDQAVLDVDVPALTALHSQRGTAKGTVDVVASR
jgi:UrcA family protein